MASLAPDGACDYPAAWLTRGEQGRLIQINARRRRSAEAAIAPCAAVRDFPKTSVPAVTVAGTFLPAGAAAQPPRWTLPILCRASVGAWKSILWMQLSLLPNAPQ